MRAVVGTLECDVAVETGELRLATLVAVVVELLLDESVVASLRRSLLASKTSFRDPPSRRRDN